MKLKEIWMKLVILFFVITGGICTTDICARAEELYFNDSGDLVFSTYDRKATSGIRYYTIGWVLKRYDDEIGASGQYTVNIPKSGYLYEITDPANPAYIYSVFVIDGDTILERIGNASGTWKSQLEKYGGYVYIDSLLTVKENGIPQGGIYQNGMVYGEVYHTYQGIRNARNWADGDKLAAYFGLKVKYPYVSPRYSLVFDKEVSDTFMFQSKPFGSFRVASGTKEKEVYDVSAGIPSGSDLYVEGSTEKFCYEAEYQKISGQIRIPVQIVTIYQLKWTDTKGIYHQENQRVERWYYVNRGYTYVAVGKVRSFSLANINVDKACFSPVNFSGFSKSGNISRISYGSTGRHISISGGISGSGGVIPVVSVNGQRPDIPDTDQMFLAEKLVPQVTVWSDSLKIEGQELISNRQMSGTAAGFQPYQNIPRQTVYRQGVTIPDNTQNSTQYQGSATMIYTADNGEKRTFYAKTNQIVVHTPIAVRCSVIGERTSNQSITPYNEDIVLGEKFVVRISCLGKHLDIPGYGEKNYQKFAGEYYVKFPFSVKYGKDSYAKDTWIKLRNTNSAFRLDTGVKKGEYEVMCRVIAKNCPSGIDLQSVSQTGANLDISKYCVVNTCKVRVIGKIFGLTLDCAGLRYQTGTRAVYPEPLEILGGSMPAEISLKKIEDDFYKLGIYAYGIGEEREDQIEINASYAVLKQTEEGDYQRIPVDVYLAEDENFTKDNLVKMPERFVPGQEEKREIQPGIYHYTATFNIGKHLVIVEKGRDISDIHMKSEYLFRDENVVLNLDIYGLDQGERCLSYENAANEPRGYCNMWKREGFSVDQYANIPLKCGDILIFSTKELIKNESQIIGTH